MAQPSVRARWKATYMVSVGLPVLPGLTAAAGEFAEPVGARRVQKFGVTARQVTQYPVRAKAPAAVAYEYYTPANRAAPRPAQLVVEKKK
jgi:hypothetical protein